MLIILVGNLTKLKNITIDDFYDLYEVLSNESIMNLSGCYPVKLKNYKKMFINFTSSNIYGIYVLNKLIGYISLNRPSIKKLSSTVEIGITINENYHSKGYGYDSLNVLISNIKLTHAYNYVMALVKTTNTKSQRLFEKLGFIKKTVLYDYDKDIKDVVYDVIYYELII